MATATKRKPTDATEGHLPHLVPDKMFADEYVSRKIGNVRDLELLAYAKAAMNNTLLFVAARACSPAT